MRDRHCLSASASVFVRVSCFEHTFTGTMLELICCTPALHSKLTDHCTSLGTNNNDIESLKSWNSLTAHPPQPGPCFLGFLVWVWGTHAYRTGKEAPLYSLSFRVLLSAHPNLRGDSRSFPKPHQKSCISPSFALHVQTPLPTCLPSNVENFGDWPEPHSKIFKVTGLSETVLIRLRADTAAYFLQCRNAMLLIFRATPFDVYKWKKIATCLFITFPRTIIILSDF